MRDGGLLEGGIERRNILPGHVRDRSDLVPLPSEELLRLGNSLQVDIETQRCCVIQYDLEAISRLPGRCGLAVPDQLKRIPDVILGNLGHRDLAEFRQDMELQWAEPSSGNAVSLEVGLAALEGIKRNIPEQMSVAGGFLTLSAPMFDRVFAFGNQSPIVGRNFPGVLQGECRQAAKTHLSTSTVQGVTEDPLSAAILTLDQTQAMAVLVLAGRGSLHKKRC